MFTSLLEHTVTVKRLTSTTGGRRTYVEVGPYPCIVQPLNAEQTMLHGLAMGRAFACYADIDDDVKTSDLAIVDDTTYHVSGVERRNYGDFPHLKLILHTEDA